jgi:hypothetical protein
MGLYFRGAQFNSGWGIPLRFRLNSIRTGANKFWVMGVISVEALLIEMDKHVINSEKAIAISRNRYCRR